MLSVGKVLKRHFPIHFTMGTNVEVTFSHLRYITTTKCFNAICSARWALCCVYFINYLFNKLYCEMVFAKVFSDTFYYGNWCWSHFLTPFNPYQQGLMFLPKLQSIRSTTKKPIGSTYHELSLKFYWVFSLGQRGTCPGMPDRGVCHCYF